MKKTNVMIEVSDNLYEEIVEPYKKRKGFGKLVVQLLEAYRTNDSIYSYINGTMDGLENEATEELIKDLNNMKNSLNMFGVFQSQAEVVIDEGQKAFNEFGTQAREDSSKFSDTEVKASTGDSQSLTREDVVTIVNDSISDIKGMLQKLMEGGVVSAPVVEKVQGAVETKINVGLNEAITEPVSSANVQDREVYVPVDVSKEDEAAAESAINSLLGSISF